MRVSLDDVHFRYSDGPPVLKGVTAAFRDGQVTALVGSNGSGKTTLLRVLAGLAHPQGGQVTFAQGETRAAFLERTHGAAMLAWESASSGPWVAHVIDTLGIAQLLNRPYAQLSRAEGQRLSLARVLAEHSDVILLDEPSSDLDEPTIAGLASLVRDLRGAGSAVIIGTCDLDLAWEWADQVAILAGGRVTVRDPCDALLDQRGARLAGLRAVRPPDSCRPVRNGRGARAGPSHGARLAYLVREHLGLSSDVKVKLQQTVAGGLARDEPITVVSVSEPQSLAWVFDCPLCELSPHELRTVLVTNPKGHTHVNEY